MDARTLRRLMPQLLRRVRRTADLSQAELAAALGVNQSTVARWETGALEPGLWAFARAVGLAGYGIEVVDPDGRRLAPMRDDADLDQQGRRLPAHLDAHVQLRRGVGDHYLSVSRRHHRDFARELAGVVPDDHPTLAEERARWRARLRPGLDRLAALSRASAPPEVPCTCPVECYETPGCRPGCPCVCEPDPWADWPDA